MVSNDVALGRADHSRSNRLEFLDDWVRQQLRADWRAYRPSSVQQPVRTHYGVVLGIAMSFVSPCLLTSLLT
jgi:hypothetical protein